jgi:hypothetical protein
VRIEIPGNHVFFVRWSCRRCGHAGGVAKTTIPLPESALTEPVVRNLFDALRQKLVKKHLAGQGCAATVEDFRIQRGQPEDAQIVGLV